MSLATGCQRGNLRNELGNEVLGRLDLSPRQEAIWFIAMKMYKNFVNLEQIESRILLEIGKGEVQDERVGKMIMGKDAKRLKQQKDGKQSKPTDNKAKPTPVKRLQSQQRKITHYYLFAKHSTK